MGGLRAGVARTTINPPLGTYLIGYGDRIKGCNAIHDDLTATALVLDDGTTRIAAVALDMLCLNEHVVARIRDGIASGGGPPPDHVMICCSHTHAAPIAYAGGWSRPSHRRFIDPLVKKVVDLVLEADRERRPVSLSRGLGEAGIAVNRREVDPDGNVILGVNPDGFIDRSLHVLELRDPEGRPVATVVNFACHGTVLGPQNRAVSADWPGAMRREVESATGAPCLFIQGATANQNPGHEWGDDDIDAVERLGSEVASRVLRVCKDSLRAVTATPVRAARERVWLPTVPHLDERGRELGYRQVASRLGGVPRFLVDLFLDSRYPWRTITRRGEGGRPELALEVHALRFGECAIVSHAAETFSEIGNAIKQASPLPHTLFAGYTNGCIGYIPTAEAHALGGYEVEVAPLAYRMSGLFARDCDRRVIERSLSLLERLAA
jgi:hypothetical protein